MHHSTSFISPGSSVAGVCLLPFASSSYSARGGGIGGEIGVLVPRLMRRAVPGCERQRQVTECHCLYIIFQPGLERWWEAWRGRVFAWLFLDVCHDAGGRFVCCPTPPPGKQDLQAPTNFGSRETRRGTACLHPANDLTPFTQETDQESGAGPANRHPR